MENPAITGHVLQWGSHYGKYQYGTTTDINMHGCRSALVGVCILWVFSSCYYTVSQKRTKFGKL